MATMKRERWSEADVMALPPAEHDFVEWKGGQFITSSGFRENLEKAISAFANSGGGHLVIGVGDDGQFEGVDRMRGTTSMREWLEQRIGTCVSPPLADFRVHEVERAPDSAIPAGRVVLVIDVGDSALAPHQAESQRVYFYRQAGRSERAPHFYLEALRSRLIGPKLRPELLRLECRRRYRVDGDSFNECRVVFLIHNEGNVAAYKWALVLESVKYDDDDVKRWRFEPSGFPRAAPPSRVKIGDETILPGLIGTHYDNLVGFFVQGQPVTQPDMVEQLKSLMRSVTLTYRAVSEISRGESVVSRLDQVIDVEALAKNIFDVAPE